MHTPTYSTTRRDRRHVISDLRRAISDYAPGGDAAGMPFYVHTGNTVGPNPFDIVRQDGVIYGIPFVMERFAGRDGLAMWLVTLRMFGHVIPVGVVSWSHFDRWDASGSTWSSSANLSAHLSSLVCRYNA